MTTTEWANGGEVRPPALPPDGETNGVQHEESQAQEHDERPTLKIVGGQLPELVEQLREALVRDDPNLYQRSGELVTIVREPERREAFTEAKRIGRSILLRTGTPRVTVVQPSALILRAARAALWQRFDRKNHEWYGVDPCPNTVAAFRSSPECWVSIAPLRGILETPGLAPSGRLICKPGYDEETAYVLIPSCDPGPIDEHPTRDHARSALRYLWHHMACDFPFRGVGEPAHRYDGGVYVDTDPERSLQWTKALTVPDAFIGVASVLTLLGRPAILGPVPGMIFEAASQGSGKSLQMHAVSMIATGRPASVMTYPMKDGKPNEEELEKVLGAYALSDAAIIAFDNVKGTLGGPGIEQRLTAKKESSFRVLGVSERRTLPWHALILFSINNASMNDDMAQRTLVSRVESPREDPRSRPASSFRHPELLDALEERRDKLVRAALVILRAYISARSRGETAEVDGGTMGSFEAWSRLIPPAILWAGGPNILLAKPEAGSGSDEEAEAHAALLRGWPEAWQGQRASFILDAAFNAEDEARRATRQGMPHPPDGLDDVRAAMRALTRTPEGRRPSPHAFGLVLKRLVGKLRDGARLARGRDTHTKVALWSVERTQ